MKYFGVAASAVIVAVFSAGPCVACGEADAHVATLEDFYGETGTQFRAALGFNTREADTNTIGGSIGFEIGRAHV